MNLLFLIPSLGYGLILFLTSGNGMLLFLSLATMAVWLLHSSNKSFDLSQSVRFEADRVWIGDRRLNQFPPTWGSSIRNLVYQAAFQNERPEDFASEGEANSIGVTATGEKVMQPISKESPHAILIGPTGAGKTELMKLIARDFGGKIWAIDFKGGAGFRDFPGVERLMTSFDPGQLDIWKRDFEARLTSPINPKLLIVVDELGEVLGHPLLAKFIESIAAKGRSLNVMLMAANQTLSQVPRTIWVNCSNRISVSADLVDRAQLGFTSKPMAAIEGQGSAELVNRSGHKQFYFGFGVKHGSSAEAETTIENPLLVRVASKPQ